MRADRLWNASAKGANFRYTALDFDGTVSLVREGWQGIMSWARRPAQGNCPTRNSPSKVREAGGYAVSMAAGDRAQRIPDCRDINALEKQLFG